jgi:hypothetical protein
VVRHCKGNCALRRQMHLRDTVVVRGTHIDTNHIVSSTITSVGQR